jgi:PPM family protein phosphatase
MVIDQTQKVEFQILGCTGQHLGDRREQQDRVGILRSQSAPRCALALLADGVGGRSGGAIAAENVMMASQRLFDEFNPKHDSVELFFAALVNEVHTILGLSAYTSKTDPHSTMVALLLQPERADWCHVGDSRLYFFRNGIEYGRTADHTLAAKMIAEGTMTPERAILHPNAMHLVHTLGGERAPEASMDSVDHLQHGDRFLLCSDGLWSYFHDPELAHATRSADLKDNSKQLIIAARARANGHGDNCSLVLMGVENKAELSS